MSYYVRELRKTRRRMAMLERRMRRLIKKSFEGFVTSKTEV